MSVLRRVGVAIADQYRGALRLFATAPLALALVIVPEFVQHVVEIRLGMFGSREAARALANDPTRWAFGYVKLAGFTLAITACARAVWTLRHGGRWYDLHAVAWPRFLLGALLFSVIGSLATPLDGRVAPWLHLAFNVVFSLASLPFLFVALAGLFGDRATPWRPLLTRCWRAVGLLLLLMLTGFGAMQALHLGDHLLAMGRPSAIVWALMLWDSIVVGMLAAVTGGAFALSYELARERAGT